MKIKLFRGLGSFAVSTALWMQPACSAEDDGNDALHAEAVVVDQTTQALASGQIAFVSGTYTNCTKRTGSWSVAVAPAVSRDDALSVLLNDTACVLTLTGLELTTGGPAIAATPSFVLSPSYQVTASTFGMPVSFYANATVSAVDFAANFVLTILYSDDPRLATRINTARFAVAESSATAGSVPAPNYALDVSGIIVQTDVADIVQFVTGTAPLTASTVTGQGYVVLNTSGLTSYLAIDTAYKGATSAVVAGGIPASDFASLINTDLTTVPQVRTLIIANTDNGITSYQVFEITFNKAP